MSLELPARQIDRGETFRGLITVTNPDGSAKDLANATATWNLVDIATGGSALANKTLGAGIVFQGTPSLGQLVVEASDAEVGTLSEWTTYIQEWLIRDGLGDVQIYRGEVTVNAAALPAVA